MNIRFVEAIVGVEMLLIAKLKCFAEINLHN